MKNNIAQQNIPSGWSQVKVGDIGATYSGLRGKSKSDFGHGSPFITYMNVFSNSKIDKNRFDLVDVSVDENQSRVKYGDVFFTISSETPEEVGMSSVLLDDVDSYYLNSFCFGFRLNNFDSLTPQYARYLFRGNNFRSKIVKMAQGSTRFNLSKERVLSLDITLPPVKEQQKIAEILEMVDEDIAKTEEVIEKTEKLKRGLMQQLFTRGIGHTKFKETKIGQIPEEWELVRMKDICTVRQGLQIAISQRFPEYKEGRYKYITLKSIKEDVYDYIESPKQSVICTKDDVLMTRTGNTGVVVTDKEGVFHNNFFLIDFDRSRVLKNYLVYYFLREDVKKIVLEKAGTTTIPDLNHDAFYGIDFVIPNLKEQKEITEILSAADEKISVNKKLKEKLILLKKGLMQDLLSGKVRTNI